jgi:hypothetical protein
MLKCEGIGPGDTYPSIALQPPATLWIFGGWDGAGAGLVDDLYRTFGCTTPPRARGKSLTAEIKSVAGIMSAFTILRRENTFCWVEKSLIKSQISMPKALSSRAD